MLDAVQLNETYLRNYIDHGCDLNDVKRIALNITTNIHGLDDLGRLLPQLNELQLNDASCISSLRDLGCRLRNLKHLSLRSCNLRDLDGVDMFPNLVCLNVSSNMNLCDITALAFHTQLQVLDLSHCNIRNPEETMEYLSTLTNLTSVKIYGNPMVIEKDSSYLNGLKNLQYLDNDCIQKSTKRRPCSAARIIQSSTPIRRRKYARPSSSNMAMNKVPRIMNTEKIDPFSALTYGTGDILCGNLVSAMRRRRKHQGYSEMKITIENDDDDNGGGDGNDNIIMIRPRPPRMSPPPPPSLSPRSRRTRFFHNLS